MDIKYIVDLDNLMVKEYLDIKGVSRNLKKKARVNNLIYVNGVNVKNYDIVHLGDELVIKIDEKLNPNFVINESELDVLYEDDYLLIVNKPSGVASQPSQKHQFDNLISMVTNYFIKKNISSNIHIVTRLDYSTSGIVIIAKSGFVHFEMSKIDILKKYLCLIVGSMSEVEGSIRLPIRRCVEHNIKRWVYEDGKMAITHYKVLREYENSSLIDVTLETGRTHQIRVHFAYLSHPLIGDKLYGDSDGDLMLHCYHIKFIHPITNEIVEIKRFPIWLKEDIHA